MKCGAGASAVRQIDACGARRVVRDAVHVEESAAGDDVLDVGAAVARDQIASERDLALVARREIGVPALGRGRNEAAVDVVQQRLAEAGAGRDQRDVAAAQRLALLQHVRLPSRRSTGTAYAIASRSFSSDTRAIAKRGGDLRARRRATARW